MEEMKDHLDDSGLLGESCEETSDTKLSESWTVLDSSHFVEDEDSSDAESVEVLENDGAASTGRNDSISDIQDDCFHEEDCGGDTSYSSMESGNTNVNNVAPLVELPKLEELETKENLRFINNVLAISLPLLIVNVILVLAFAFTNKAPLIFGHFNSSLASECGMSKNMALEEPLFDADPLLLQLSHVLSKWKKHPEREDVAAHQILKTILSFFSEDSELDSEVQDLDKKIKELDRMVLSIVKQIDTDKEMYERMITVQFIAHSMLDILCQKHKCGSFPVHTKDSSNISGDEKSQSSWHPSKLNKSSRVSFSPLTNFYFLPGSPQWNNYFWEVYQKVSSPSKNVQNGLMQPASDRLMNMTHGAKAAVISSQSDSSAWNSTSKADNGGNSLKLSANKLEEKDKYHYCESKRCHEQQKTVDKVQSKYRQKNIKAGRKQMGDELKKKKLVAKGKDVNFKPNSSETERKRSKTKTAVNDEFSGNETFDEVDKSSNKGNTPSSKIISGESQDIEKEQRSKNAHKVSKNAKKKKKRAQARLNEKVDDWNTRIADGREKLRALNQIDDWNTRMARGREKLRNSNAAEELVWVFGRAKGRGKLREDVYPL